MIKEDKNSEEKKQGASEKDKGQKDVASLNDQCPVKKENRKNKKLEKQGKWDILCIYGEEVAQYVNYCAKMGE